MPVTWDSMAADCNESLTAEQFEKNQARPFSKVQHSSGYKPYFKAFILESNDGSVA